MSGSTIGGVAGAFVGFWVGGPAGAQMGWMIGSAVGGYVDPDIIKQQGPRLNDASSQTARDGVPITFGYGTFVTAGNIIWRAPLVENIITTRERQGKGGGPVTETTTYQYTRSFATGICEGPITGLLMVKENGAIVYDARPDDEMLALGMSVQDLAASRAASAAWMRNKTLYLGDETQVPDSVMEANLGVGNVSAYRGLAYIVDNATDLTDLRGAIPQREFVVNADGVVVGTENPPDLNKWWPGDDAVPGGSAREVIDGDDGAYRNSPTVESAIPLTVGNDSSAQFGELADYMWTPDTTYSAGHFSIHGLPAWSVRCVGKVDEEVGGTVLKALFAYWQDVATGQAEFILGWRGGTNNMLPYAAIGQASGTSIDFSASVESSTFSPADMVLTWEALDPSNPTGLGTGRFYVNGVLVDTVSNCPNSSRVGDFVAVGGVEFDGSIGWKGDWNDAQIWTKTLSAEEIALMHAGVGDGDTFTEMPDAPGVYVDRSGNIPNAPTTAINRTTVAVSAIVADLCARRGIDASQIDVSELDDTVIGYRVASEGGADTFIAPLLAYSFADAGEWDGKLRFVKRGGASLFTITADDLVERDGDAFSTERVQEAELLRKNTITYIDPLATYTATTQAWERRAGTVQAKGEASIDMPVVADGDTMAQMAERRGKVAWTETEKYGCGLPVPKFARITPTDPGTFVDADGQSHRIRVTQTEEDSGVLILEEAARDRQPAYIGTVTGAVAPTLPTTSPPSPRGPTILRAFNSPFLREADATPGIQVAGTGLLAGWIGYDLYMAIGDAPEQYIGRYLNRALIGWLTEDVTSSGEPITASWYDGRVPETATDAEIEANGNVFAILTSGVVEYVQAQTVTGDDLTDIERALGGTLATSHYTDDAIVAVDAGCNFVAIDPRHAGQTLTLRAVSIGTIAADNATTTLVYDPPTYVIDGNGDADDDDTSTDPDPGGAGTPGSPTLRTIGATVSTPSLTAGEAAAAANSAAINAAFAGLPGGGGIVRTPAGTYYIDTSDPIEPVSNSRLDLATNNTTLRAASSDTTTAPSVHRDIIRIDGVHDVEIKGGHLIGYRDYWTANGGVSVYGVSEWGHGIYTTGGSYDITLYDVTGEKFIGDGLSIGRTTHDIHVLNCLFTRNRRQGISTGGDDILIENCTCTFIGLTDGTSPKAGIDIEVDLPDTNSAINVEVRGCTLTDNAGPGLIAYKSCNNLNIHDNTIERNVKGVYAYDSDTVTLHDNIIRYNATQGVHLAGSSSGWDLDGNTFFANSTRQYGTPTTGATTTSPTTTQKAKHITVASTVTGTTYGTNTYGPV